MRIKQLRFQNLNSLVGEWSIDFADPAYMTNGIFAITGPTGAGKTTILDAICLALYGRTPRLDRVNKNGNEIMSRQTGSCYAEISFETRAGEYCCHWSQQRARKKADGELQPPKHEIADLRSGQVLENKIRDVGLLVEQITGMSFIQFTRSMLLAQGGFAAFLQAPADERAPILEQITGTEVYSEISMQVHQRYREKKANLEILQAETSAIKVLSDEDEQNLQERLKIEIEQELVQQEQLIKLNEALTWLVRLAELEKQVRLVEIQWQDFKQCQEAFRADGERLMRARQAMGLDGSYSQLAEMHRQQGNETTELAQLGAEIPEQREIVIKAEKEWKQAAQNLEAMKARRKVEGATARQVRDMDSLIEQHVGQITDLRNAIIIAEEVCLDWQRKIDNCQREQQKTASAVDAIAAYLRENQRDASLVANLTGISRTFSRLEETATLLQSKYLEYQQSLADLQERQNMLAQNKTWHNRSKTALEAQIKSRQDVEEHLKKALQGREIRWWLDELDKFKEKRVQLHSLYQLVVRIQQIESEIKRNGDTLQQFGEQRLLLAKAIAKCQLQTEQSEREVEHLEKQLALENRIRDLEEERTRLEDGSPCPLCGAIHHPYATGNLPRMDETNLALQRAHGLFKQHNECLHNQQLKLAGLLKEEEHCLTLLQEAEKSLTNEKLMHDEISTTLQVDSEAFKSLDDLQKQLSRVEDSIDAYTILIKNIDEMQQQIAELTRQHEACHFDFSQSDKALQQSETQLEQVQRDGKRLLQEYQRIMTEVAELSQGALLEVAEYGISDLPKEELRGILQTLTERKNCWVEKQAEQLRLQNALINIRGELSQHEIQLQNQTEALQSNCRRLKVQQEELNQQKIARFELYAERDPDEEEARLEGEVNRAETNAEKARREQEIARSNQQRTEDRVLVLENSTRQRGGELQSMEESFARQLGQAGFDDEQTYLLARLPREEQQELSARADQLAEQATELKTRLLDRKESLRQEKDKQLSDQSRDTLEEKQQQAEQELKALRDQIGAAKNILQNSIDNRRQMQVQLEKIEQQKETLGNWQVLHDLIGSADGKKYRNYAQGLTFDLMIKHANQQLQKMSDRYLLLRNSNQALELNVIDHYQAGEIRSTTNLSGGESFLVSLALALGLSQMASRKVSVDSLFLDEGFGALDEDALDTALNTLAGLQQDGKLIGVISHVPALKERISTQIQVISQAGGRSIITGPGCQRVV